MPKNILVAQIEGKVIYLNDEPSLKVRGDDNGEYIEYLSTWIDDNLPAEGQYVRIEIMVFLK